MIFDTHAHYDDEAFDADREELLASLADNGIGNVVNVAASMRGCHATLELTERYDFVYGALGVHPDDADGLTEADMDYIEKQAAQSSKIVAIGEIGLDYYYPADATYPKTGKDAQKYWFERQIELARQVKLPIMIHSREAAKDTEDILRQTHASDVGGIIHCYSYSKECAKFYLDNGFYIGVGGVVTFKNGRKLKETVEYVPLDRIVLETDSPYLAPVPNRGKRNSSLNLPLVADEIATLKNVTREEVIETTTANAKRLLNIER